MDLRSWTVGKAHEALLRCFERKVLRKIYGAVQIYAFWRIRYNKELYSLFNYVDIIKMNRLKSAGHIVRKESEDIVTC
jgi:hypothetical protein